MKRKFLRVDTYRISKLGKSRPKLQKWRRPRGKHNKTRLNRFSYPVQPGIGFGTPKALSGKIDGLIPVYVQSQADVQKLTKQNIAIVSRRIGARKKIDLIKKLSEMNIKIENIGGKK